ncbi:MAG: type II toxin-antitoxin system Phd/YefM family antitoxin [Spirochaetes bacterium]|nr:MAG: type II toxin-antitoxin system Phd/YefM family antitoxin [Spirochaetota bacterium]RKX86628.1 MAG: type II toxin-antitoxin system Phd/YefM family antitoxin [Spirochaetota bacterium]RKX89951.1 MAG: type II toxin-antitoxin system Phd/YefM family antitoxin [Spirochaetota bacterium]
MEVYTFSEARGNFATVLDIAKKQGSVRIKRRDGQSFIITSEKPKDSPLDVEGLALDLSRDEIIDFIREGRERRVTK